MPKQYPRGEKCGNRSMTAPISANSKSNGKTRSAISFTSLARAGGVAKGLAAQRKIGANLGMHASLSRRVTW